MLEEIRVENLAIADSLSVRFDRGFNVITGETGAGKSMIVGAVALLAGERASPEMVRSGCQHLNVEGVFSSNLSGANELLESMGSEPSQDELILRRQVYSDGRSRSFANGSLITVSGLKGIGGLLLDIHGQHEHQFLISKENHIYYLDEFGKLSEKQSAIPALRRTLSELIGKESEHIRRLSELADKRDYIAFQLGELESAGVKPGEEESLEEERKLLMNAGKLSSSLGLGYDLLYDDEHAVLGRISRVLRELDSLGAYMPRIKDQENALKEAEVLVQNAAGEISKLRQNIESNPERLEELEGRLHLLSRLKAKHKCSTAELLKKTEELKSELSMISGDDPEGDAIKKQIAAIRDELSKLSGYLKKKRVKAASQLEERMRDELSTLDMRTTRFSILIENIEDEESGIEIDGKKLRLWDSGVDRVEFLVSPNAGEELKPLSKIASGGEISRIMLALRSILRRDNEVETVIFDEIDSGIGGKAARTVGEKLRKLGEKMQVICITHLPIIASQATAHYLVEKKSDGKRTGIHVEKLSGEKRVGELARMLAGDRATGTTLKQAKELLAAQKG
ncbi:MAG: DNA repair protein RecN [Candidatus Eisenbacteria bacterium]|nr:DNA repair protein RecN [Candidatus Eisenbacteria bacterium]